MAFTHLFVPKFLSKLDNQLMLHAPHIWRTRAHFVVFYALIAWISLFLIGFFCPINMFDISRTPYEIDKLKSASFLFLLICGFFAMVYWWQQVVKFRILSAKWYHSFVECCLFFVGIFMLWQAVNAFKNGIDTNIAYRVERNLSALEKEKLYANNFFLAGFLSFNNMGQFDRDFRNVRSENIDSILKIAENAYFKKGESLFGAYSKRINRQSVIIDSQFCVRKDFTNEVEYGIHNGFGQYNNVYHNWKDSINTKAEKYLKPKLEYGRWWNYKTREMEKGWRKIYDTTDDYFKLDSLYQLFTPYEKYEIDSISANSVNSAVDELRKNQDYNLLRVFPSLKPRDILNVLDTCSNAFFNHQRMTYLEVLKSKSGTFELDFKRHQIYLVFTPNDVVAYKNYLAEIMMTMPIGNYRVAVDEMEVGLYYKRDSLCNDFMARLTPRSKRVYEELLAFYINHHVKKEKSAETAGIFRWNKKTEKYKEIEKYITRGFLDTVFLYTDSLASKIRKETFTNAEVLDFMNGNLIWNVNREMEQWKLSEDSFLLVHEYREIKGKEQYVLTRKMRRDSIPIDTVYKWRIDDQLGYYGNDFKQKNNSNSVYPKYKEYRNMQISDQDSAFLDQVFTKNGYLKDSSEHSRLFFHANAFYLYLADININKSKGLLTGWNPFYLSTSNKLAIIILSFLMFFTSLVQSNLFTAAFVAFFINFVNNTIFNLGQNFQELDKNKQTFWLFSLLGILALITAFNVLFRRFKLPVIYLLINIQLLALLGIFVWLFDSQTIEQQRNYAYLSIAFWGLMVWKYRSYLALPSKR